MSTTTKPETKPRIETKQLRHDFTDLEKAGMGGDLSRVIAALRQLENEADESKAAFKTKIISAEAEVDRISTSLMNGWEFRHKRCRVVLRPKDRKKDFYLEDSPEDSKPVLTEEMTQADFEQDLIQAESRFDLREEINLFPPAGASQGILVVGRFKGRWFTALRINIENRNKIEERLDSEQKSVKQRFDAIKVAADRAMAWLVSTLGEDNAKGFRDPISKAVEPHKEREE